MGGGAPAGELAGEDAALLARLAPPAPTAYHALNPLTKAVAAAVTTMLALVFGGYLGPLVLLAGLVLPGAVAAGAGRRVARTAAIVTAPLAVAVGLVSGLTRPGTTVLLILGPFDVTLEGIDFAGQVTVRLFVMAAALTLFGLTTPARAFVVDLERRGVAPRIAFALGSVVGAVPAMLARAAMVRDAQRARGLDTEGSVVRRLRGVLPLAAPVVIGALHDVEARSLALEARAFGRPGPQHLLWAPADGGRQRAARWLLVAGLVAVVVGTAIGALPRLP